MRTTFGLAERLHPFPWRTKSKFCCGYNNHASGIPHRKPPVVVCCCFGDLEIGMAPASPNQELDDDLAGVIGDDGMMTVAGFGSLLSERSSRFTFPELKNFRMAKVAGYRRVFGHCAPIFFKRGIARIETGEISSVAVEPCEGSELLVACFEVPASKAAVEAFIEREHEFRFVAVKPEDLNGGNSDRMAVLCCRYTDEEYKAKRCPPQEFELRYGQYGIHTVFRDDILPCRVYLRHCILAARNLDPQVYDNFLDHSFLGDRKTSIRQYLQGNPDILEEMPPPELIERYSG